MRDTTRVRVGLVTLLAIWALAGCESAEQNKAAELRQKTAEAREKYVQARDGFTGPRGASGAPAANAEIAGDLKKVAGELGNAIAATAGTEGDLITGTIANAQLLLAEIETFRAKVMIASMDQQIAQAQRAAADVTRDLVGLGSKGTQLKTNEMLLSAGLKEIQDLSKKAASDLKALQTEAEELTTKIKTLTGTISGLRGEADKLNATASELRTKSGLAKGPDRLETLEKALTAEAAAREKESEATTLERKLNEAKTLLARNQQAQAPIREQIGVLEKALERDADLEAAVAALKKEIGTQVQAVADSYAVLGDLTSKILTADSDVYGVLGEGIKAAKQARMLVSGDKQAVQAELDAQLTRASQQIQIALLRKDLRNVLQQTETVWATLPARPQTPSSEAIDAFLKARADSASQAVTNLEEADRLFGILGRKDKKIQAGAKEIEAPSKSVAAMMAQAQALIEE